jgi:UDP-N-acetylglucosamine 4-epimerase
MPLSALFMHALLNGQSPAIDGDGNKPGILPSSKMPCRRIIKRSLTENKEALGEVFNVAVGERVSINGLYDILCGLPSSTQRPFYRDARPGDIRDSLADISKAQRLLAAMRPA